MTTNNKRDRSFLRPWMVGAWAMCMLSGIALGAGGLRTLYVRITESASAPGISGTPRYWAKSTDHHPYFTDASNVDHDLLAGGGGGSSTLAASYAAGASQTDETMTLDATRLGPVIKTYSGQSAAALTLNDTFSNDIPLLQLQSGGSTHLSLWSDGGIYGTLFCNSAGSTGNTCVNTNDGNDMLVKAGGSQVLQLSSGTTAPSISSGISVYLPTATTPTIAPPSGGTLRVNTPVLMSTATAGSTPGVIIDANQSWNGNTMLSIRSNGSQYLGLEPDSTKGYLYLGYPGTPVSQYLFWDASGIGWHSLASIFYPVVNTEWAGSSAHKWGGFFGSFFGTPSTTIASASTIAPTSSIVHVTGTVTISTITPPTPASGGTFTGAIDIITDSALSFGSGGNIAATGHITTAAGQEYHAVYDGTNWYIK